jgi:hypothetical protein
MKKVIFGLISILIIMLTFSFKTIYDLKNSTACVEEKKGILIFSYSKPEKKFRIIGEVKNGKMINSDHQSVGEYLTDKAKKQYPTSQGIIIKFEKGMSGKGIYAEVIEFTE